jgi:L-fuculose-phosphate aldolase
VRLGDGSAPPGSRPSSETPLHRAVYAATDAGAIVHTHSHFATVLSTLVDELPPIHYAIHAFGGPVRVARYETFGTAALADSVTEALEGRTGALMANHGAIVCGRDLPHAVGLAVTLEWLASVYYHARLAGSPHILSDADIDAVRDQIHGLEATRR